MTLTLSGQLSHAVRLASKVLWRSETPQVLLLKVWPFPLSLATTRGISFDFSSSPYLDVSVQGVPHAWLCIHHTFHGSSPWVFPHSEICGSKLICSSPQLIAACHVLRRLPMPRHSPYALLRLNYLYVSDPFGLNITVLVIAWIAVFHTLQCWSRFSYPPLAKLFLLPFKFDEKTWFRLQFSLLLISCFFPLLCLSCMSHWFFLQNQYVLYLIRFSMNFSLTFIKLYSIMNFFHNPVKINEFLR